MIKTKHFTKEHELRLLTRVLKSPHLGFLKPSAERDEEMKQTAERIEKLKKEIEEEKKKP